MTVKISATAFWVYCRLALTLIALRHGCTTSRDARTAKNSVGERWSAGLFVSIPPIFSPPTPPIFQEIP